MPVLHPVKMVTVTAPSMAARPVKRTTSTNTASFTARRVSKMTAVATPTFTSGATH